MGVLLKISVPIVGQFQFLQHRELVGLFRALSLLVGCLARACGADQFGDPGLELNGIGASGGRGVNQVVCILPKPVMVDTGFCDDEAGMACADCSV